MALLALSEDLAQRYAPYLQELRDFFSLHDLRYGAPDDLTLLTLRLSTPSTFPAELASMVRSFIFRERGNLLVSDLLSLISVAVGGIHIKSSAQDLEQSITDLSNFLTAVAHAPVDQPPREPAVSESNLVQLVDVTSGPATAKKSTQQTAEAQTSVPPFVLDGYSETASTATDRSAVELQRAPRASVPNKPTSPAVNVRKRWITAAIAFPLLLLVALLFHYSRFSSSTRAAKSQVAATEPALITNPNPYNPPPSQSSIPLSSPSSSPEPSSPHSHPVATIRAVQQQSPPSSGRLGSVTPQFQPRERISAPRTASPSIPSANQRITTRPRSPQLASAPPPGSRRTTAPDPSPSPVQSASANTYQSPFNVSSGIMTSHLISSAQPAYPKVASLTHLEGQVLLQAVVASDGRVKAVHVLSGHHLLRGAAIKAVGTWRYRPYLADGHPVDVATIITLDFKLPR